jgi:hypothetical protein
LSDRTVDEVSPDPGAGKRGEVGGEFATGLGVHDRYALARRDVEPKRQVARGLGELGDTEGAPEQAGLGAEEIAAAP